ncbi:NAD-dependent epimerase/dehydratase family protein [Pelagibacterium xiamenense]|uniref:NAD-dependent epimerase/dehydratase family protein n=1 Tax=Pelagibacterium xiamenense TaxID=2901140 RepID=UPI001E46B713|nr:NAD-dependent epimerase/dehydratase family protein [Pelagibacterium xiamenense]MCD7061307.1 NAD-dependent epimerase/dehydratase family protein [Pelagibacterium xiamenense]
MPQSKDKTITILGINGHIGQAVAKAFATRHWRVIGFGRSNKNPIAGVEFIKGDADSVRDMKAAAAQSGVVFNGLNLPYDKWFDGAAETLNARVIEAVSGDDKTLLFPGNIYSYKATDKVVTPDLRQDPQTPRGAIRVRMEEQIRKASAAGAFQAIILRAGDFYGPNTDGTILDALVLREAAKGKVALSSKRTTRHAWAYLPDLAEAFAILAEKRETFGTFENFHFGGHFVAPNETFAAIERAAKRKLNLVSTPWTTLKLAGFVMPVLREVVKMRYLWDYEMRLRDDRLDAILGPEFGTPYDEAIAKAVAPFFARGQKAA